MNYKVVIIQTSGPGFGRISMELEQAGFPKGSYFITRDPEDAWEELVSEERQLLITGIFLAEGDAEDFVRRAKARNPGLTAVGFSTFWSKVFPPFDAIIRKDSRDGGSADFLAYIRGFLANL
jgi:hypothetical protein